MKQDKYPIVRVQWEDPTSIDEWGPISDACSEPAKVDSVGFLLQEDLQYVVICLNISSEDECSQSLTIPSCLILNLEYLDE